MLHTGGMLLPLRTSCYRSTCLTIEWSLYSSMPSPPSKKKKKKCELFENRSRVALSLHVRFIANNLPQSMSSVRGPADPINHHQLTFTHLVPSPFSGWFQKLVEMLRGTKCWVCEEMANEVSRRTLSSVAAVWKGGRLGRNSSIPKPSL